MSKRYSIKGTHSNRYRVFAEEDCEYNLNWFEVHILKMKKDYIYKWSSMDTFETIEEAEAYIDSDINHVGHVYKEITK